MPLLHHQLAPNARQPVGGFSALLDTAGRDTFWAMPDNGFGSKSNSHSFLLRVYRVQVDFETARGGSGEVQILDWITLHDPDKRVPFGIITEGTAERLLTSGDFDIESMRGLDLRDPATISLPGRPVPRCASVTDVLCAALVRPLVVRGQDVAPLDPGLPAGLRCSRPER